VPVLTVQWRKGKGGTRRARGDDDDDDDVGVGCVLGGVFNGVCYGWGTVGIGSLVCVSSLHDMLERSNTFPTFKITRYAGKTLVRW
jgi:hypothetical protein